MFFIVTLKASLVQWLEFLPSKQVARVRFPDDAPFLSQRSVCIQLVSQVVLYCSYECAIGLVVKYFVANEVPRVRFPDGAFCSTGHATPSTEDEPYNKCRKWCGPLVLQEPIPVGVVGNIRACHARARGSIPRSGVLLLVNSKASFACATLT